MSQANPSNFQRIILFSFIENHPPFRGDNVWVNLTNTPEIRKNKKRKKQMYKMPLYSTGGEKNLITKLVNRTEKVDVIKR